MFSKLLVFPIFVVCFVLLLFTLPSFANTVGVTFSDSTIEGLDLGVFGDLEVDLHEFIKLGAEGQFQRGDLYLGNIDVAVTFGQESFGVRVETNNNFKGGALDDIGRTNELGLGLVFPIAGLEISGGLFGKTGNPFQPTYELADPTDPDSATIADSGILIKEESTLNLALKTEIDWKRLEVSLRTLFEVAGEGDKYHQLDVGVETGGQFTKKIGWTLQGKVIGQLIALEEGAKIYSERTVLGSIQYSF